MNILVYALMDISDGITESKDINVKRAIDVNYQITLHEKLH